MTKSFIKTSARCVPEADIRAARNRSFKFAEADIGFSYVSIQFKTADSTALQSPYVGGTITGFGTISVIGNGDTIDAGLLIQP